MSLLVWLPLNRDLGNKGCKDITLSEKNTSIAQTGKLGRSCYFNGSNAEISIPNVITEDFIDFSICAWVKRVSTYFRVYCARTVAAGGGIMISAESNYVVFDDGTRWNPNISIPTEWTHIALTRNKQGKKLYLNGELVASTTTIGNLSNLYNTAFIGALATSSSVSEHTEGYINDFRIYDECLSIEQIKELSKALVLHYPLNSGYGGENLIIGAGAYTKDSPLTRTRNSRDGWQKEPTLYTDYIPAGKYTIQAQTDGVWHEHSTPTDGYPPENRFCSIWLVSQASDNDSGKDINICIGATVPKTITLSYGGKYFIRTNLYSNNVDYLTVNFWDIKLEKGDKSSLWSPNKNDTLYKILGYNSNIEYDTSGYGINCLKTTNFSHSKDTVLYDSSTQFNQNGYMYNSDFGLNLDKFTMSFWIKPVEMTTSQHFILGTFNNWCKNGIGIWRDKPSNPANYSVLFRSANEDTYYSYRFYINNDEYALFTLKYDGEKFYLYKNGAMINSVTYGKNGLIENPVLYLGTSLYNSNPVSEYEEALLSDFRIYATALSDDEIMSLYKTKAKIDKNGKLYCNEYIEGCSLDNLFRPESESITPSIGTLNTNVSTNGANYYNTKEITITFTQVNPEGSLTGCYFINNTTNYKSIIEQNDGFYYFLSFDAKASKNFKMSSVQNERLGGADTKDLTTEWQHYSWLRKSTDSAYSATVFYINKTTIPIEVGDSITVKNYKLIRLTERQVTELKKNGTILSSILIEDSDKTKFFRDVIETNEIIEN